MMTIPKLQSLFQAHKESTLFHRYIHNDDIAPLLDKLSSYFQIDKVGASVLNQPIHSIALGSGPKKILMWSQMHGNESTTTKALFDFLNTCISNHVLTDAVLSSCTICCIPILNPDGAKAYTRVNANEIDLNRDAQMLSQPESLVLKEVFERFRPDFCFNLHGQRTIFSAGNSNKPATVSFLAPAQDQACTVTPNRKVAMTIISQMNKMLQQLIPGQVGVYDDAFNLNCVGDTFQSKNIPTILFEAGHFPNDYAREKTREFIYISYMVALDYIAKSNIDGSEYAPYFDIPENAKYFYDVIIRRAQRQDGGDILDIGILFEERLKNEIIEFVPIVKKMGDLSSFYGHRELNANGAMVLGANDKPLELEGENVFVKLNNEKIAFFSK